MTNVKDSYRRGIELQAQIIPCSWFNWNANATFSQNHIKNYVEIATGYDEEWNTITSIRDLGKTDISYSPNIIAGSNIQLIPAKGVAINWMSKYAGDQYFDNTSSKDRQLDAYWVNNLRFDFDLNVKGLKKTTFQFLVNNFLDKQYSNNAYGGNWYEQGVEKTWAYYFPQAGRNYATKLIVRF